jgi:hypothetical protein
MALTKISRGLLDTGVSDSSDATAITISSSEQVMIGTTDAGYPDYGDSLTVADVDGGGGNAGMTIRSGTSSYGTFYFSDATGTAAGTYAGKMQYNHSNNSMVFGTNSADRLTIDSSGNVGIGITNPSDYYSEQLVVSAEEGEGGITIKNATDNNGYLMFADGTSGSEAYRGYIMYGHSVDEMRLYTSAYMNFYSNGSERMRIDSSGNLLVGTTTALNSSHTIIKNGGVPLHVKRTTDASAGNSLFLGYGTGGSTANVSIRGDGDLENTNGNYDALASDERLKENIVDVSSQWEDVKNIKIKNFTLKHDKSGLVQMGAIAQELQEVCPNLIKRREASPQDIENSDGLIKEGDEVLTYKMSIMQLKGFVALQEAMTKIEELTAKVEELENKINE